MQLSVRDIARMLKVSEKEIFHWIEAEELPAYKVHDQYRFNRTELLEWISSHQIPVPFELFPHAPATVTFSLTEALSAGGIHHGLSGSDKISVLSAMVQQIPLNPGADRDHLLQILLAREALASTGVGDGIAIPHVRNPVIFPVVRPTVTLFFLSEPVDFQALDGKPVRSLFVLVSPTVRAHLQLLSRLAFVLRDPDFRRRIHSQDQSPAILDHLRSLEAKFKPC